MLTCAELRLHVHMQTHTHTHTTGGAHTLQGPHRLHDQGVQGGGTTGILQVLSNNLGYECAFDCCPLQVRATSVHA